MLKSWKTTACGIMGFLTVLFTMGLQPLLDNDPATVANWGAVGAAAVAALGLVLARDNNVTSEAVGAKKGDGL